jgi:mitogen-activated protein kinase organizer 1
VRGVLVKTYAGHGYEVRDVCVTPDNARLASVGGDRAVLQWDVATGAILRKWRGHDGPANCVADAASGALAVSGGDDSTVRLWDARSRSPDPVQTLRGAGDAVVAVAVDGPCVLSASVDGRVRAHDARAGRLVVDALPAPLVSLALTRDRACLAVACTDGRVALLDRAGGAALASYAGRPPSDVKTDVAVTADDAVVLCGGAAGLVHAWGAVSEAALPPLDALSPAAITSVAAHPTGVGVLAACADGSVAVFE